MAVINDQLQEHYSVDAEGIRLGDKRSVRIIEPGSTDQDPVFPQKRPAQKGLGLSQKSFNSRLGYS